MTQPDLGPRYGSLPAPSAARRVGRRVVTALAAALALLVVLFLLGGGWYFSGKIHDDGLEVRHPGPSYGQEVVAIGDGTITIADPADEEPLLDGDMVYGLEWDGGYGQLSGDGTGDEEVTRDFELLSGEPPHPGTVVSPDRAAFSDPESALDRPVEDVTVDSDLGPLDAWYAYGPSRTWAVLVHGKGGERPEMLRAMRTTVDAGMPSLDISYRNDAGAPRDPSGIYQFGRTEWRDLDAAVRYATGHGARRVVLVGASMGGGIIASYLRHTPRAPVAGLVLDSPMLDFGATVSSGAEQERLPVLGRLPAPLTWTAKRLAALRYGVDWSAIDYLTDTRWLRRPTLVLHGDGDKTVPLRTSEELGHNRPDRVTLVVVPGAGHVESWNVDPAAYDAAVAPFLRTL